MGFTFRKIGTATVYHGNCHAIIPSLPPATVLCTDPPYGIEDMVGGYSRSGATIANDRTLDAMRDGVAEIWSAAAPGAVGFIFYSCRNTPDVMRAIPARDYLGEIVWDKKAPGMGAGIRYQHENVAVLVAPGGKLSGTTFSVIPHIRQAKMHPHEKPVGVMRRLLEVAPPGLVIDPFMGSGSTLIAAVQLGRECIGIEVDEKHFETACARLEREQEQARDMFAATAPVEQTSLFGE